MLLRINLFLLVVMSISGCSVNPINPSNRGITLSDMSVQMVAQDFVSVLTQVPEFSPSKTTFVVTGNNQSLTTAFVSRLLQNGYRAKIDDGSTQIGRALDLEIAYSNPTSDVVNDIERIATIQITPGDIKFMRRYAVLTRGDVKPHSQMLSSGVESGSFNIDDTIFFTEITDAALPGNKANLANETVPVDSGSPGPLPLLDTQNFRENGGTNYADVFNTYTLVDRYLIEFGNDSTELSLKESALLESALKNFNPSTDVISIIGTSHGFTSIPGGQKGLAQGRAAQVHENILGRGIPLQSLYTESSWSTNYYDEVLPRRGVVFQLFRTELSTARIVEGK